MAEPPDDPPLIAIVGRPEDEEAVLALMVIIDEGIPEGLLSRVVADALLSLYLNLSVRAWGVDGVERAVRRIQRNLPRIREAFRANQAQRKGPLS